MLCQSCWDTLVHKDFVRWGRTEGFLCALFSCQQMTVGRCGWHVDQRFFFSRNIGYVTPKIVYFHYLKKYFSGWKYPTNVLSHFEREALLLMLTGVGMSPNARCLRPGFLVISRFPWHKSVCKTCKTAVHLRGRWMTSFSGYCVNQWFYCVSFLVDALIPKSYFLMIRINSFRGDLTDISATKASPAVGSEQCFLFKIKCAFSSVFFKIF